MCKSNKKFTKGNTKRRHLVLVHHVRNISISQEPSKATNMLNNTQPAII